LYNNLQEWNIFRRYWLIRVTIFKFAVFLPKWQASA
jgi:hypothetical protein